jgi:uncharacterized membrane protein YfcA
VRADQIVLLLAAAALGGGLNSVVGGGSFVTFPALVLVGVAPVSANATSTLVLVPGALASTVAYRAHLRQPRGVMPCFVAASLVGGLLGAALLLRTRDTFARLVPWLLLGATVLFTVGPLVTRRLRLAPAEGAAAVTPRALAVGTVVQLAISIYGGYFGGGMGIMMLALWSLVGLRDIHAMNGLRTLVGALLNMVAFTAFALAHAIAWRPGLLMAVAATLAGYGGAAIARRASPKWMRRFVVAVAWAMTGYFFVRG